MMVPDYDGLEVEGLDGGCIGRVERTYLCDLLQIRFVEVRVGTVLPKHRLIPTSEVERTDDVLRVPYTKGTVLESPDVTELGDTLDGDVLAAVRDYYAPPEPSATVTPEADSNEDSPATDDATRPMPLMATVVASAPPTEAPNRE